MIFRKIAAVGIGLLMMFQSTAVFAGTFNDLKDSEWAEPYIEKMASKGIITGFNGAYKPVDPVNKYSAVVMIYRTLKAAGKLDDASVNAAVSKYATVLATNKVPAWPDLHQGVAWMLENGVIQAEELKYFMSGENHINARRYELSIFLGKSLNVFLKENVNTFISLNFKDANLISSSSAPYVNLLVNKKALNGDLEGNFKPYDPMTRAAMAKVLSVSYDLIAGSVAPTTGGTAVIVPTPSTTPQTPVVPVVSSSEAKGTLKSIQKIGTTYQIVITPDGSQAEQIYTTEKTLATVKSDGATYGFDKLIIGDKLTLRLNTQKQITEIVISPWSQEYEGILKKQLNFEGKPQITIQLENGKEMVLDLGKSVDIKRDDDSAKMTELVPGDSVKVRTAYDVVDRIYSYSAAKKEVTGIIQQIVIGKVNRITVLTDDAGEKEYTLTSSATIEVDNDDDMEIYDLRVGYEVDLTTTGSVVTAVDASESNTSSQLSGIISEIYKDINVITLKQMVDGAVKYTSVTYDNDTKVRTADGDTRKVTVLDEEDTVFIYGIYKDTFFLAEKIIVIE